MASKSGLVFLVALGLVAIGLAQDDGDDGTGPADADDSDLDIVDEDTCDGVVILETASGTASIPGDEASVGCEMGAGGGDADAVRALQRALVTCHGQDIPVDGVYGEQTEQAVASVQKQSGLAVDGTFDPRTRDAM